MLIGNYKIDAVADEETKNKINNLKELAEVYGLSLTEYLLFLLYDEGIKTFEIQ